MLTSSHRSVSVWRVLDHSQLPNPTQDPLRTQNISTTGPSDVTGAKNFVKCSVPPTHRNHAAFDSVGNIAIVHGGCTHRGRFHKEYYDELYFYNVQSRTWYRPIVQSGFLPSPRAHHSLCALGDPGSVNSTMSLYVFGGISKGEVILWDFLEYSVENGEWKCLHGIPNTPPHMIDSTFTAVGGCMYLYGGIAHRSKRKEYRDTHCTKYFFTWNPREQTWRNLSADALSELLAFEPNRRAAKKRKANTDTSNQTWDPGPRCGHSAVGHEDTLFIFGGMDYQSTPHNDLWSFNIHTENWRFIFTHGVPHPPTAYASCLVLNFMAHDESDCFGGLYFVVIDGLRNAGDSTLGLHCLTMLHLDTQNWLFPSMVTSIQVQNAPKFYLRNCFYVKETVLNEPSQVFTLHSVLPHSTSKDENIHSISAQSYISLPSKEKDLRSLFLSKFNVQLDILKRNEMSVVTKKTQKGDNTPVCSHVNTSSDFEVSNEEDGLEGLL